MTRSPDAVPGNADLPAIGRGHGRDQGRGPAAIGRHRLVAEIARRLRGECRVPAGALVLAAVSGGADSTAMLLACCELRRRPRRQSRGQPLIRLAAAHVHHHLRDSADEDAAFVTDLCARLDVDLHVQHVHPGELPGNVSANARHLRYRALREVAGRIGAPFVMVAHHAEDQLETVLMNLCRGRGLGGMKAMRWTRTLIRVGAGSGAGDGQGKVSLIRPLLASRRSQCEDLCRAAGIAWRDDPGNADVSRARARLRRDVLPVLESLWPGAARRAAQTADAMAAANDLLALAVVESFGEPGNLQWDRAALKKLPTPIVAAGLRRAARATDPEKVDEPAHALLLKAAAAIGDEVVRPRRFAWPGGLSLLVSSQSVGLTSDHGALTQSKATPRRRREPT